MESTKRILITGGAGFIGANLALSLLELQTIEQVVALDNLSTGFEDNLLKLKENPKFIFIKGDITDASFLLSVMAEGFDVVVHLAALGSIPRSLANPLNTFQQNIVGTQNVLWLSVECKIPRVVFASSSSVYGNDTHLPKVEHKIGIPFSPYALSKLNNEQTAYLFHERYGLETLGLRFFNVFGPMQSPMGAYAAVIPQFIDAIRLGKAPQINGDGLQTRDFTFVGNAVQAITKCIFTENELALNQIYNVACGMETNLINLVEELAEIMNVQVTPQFNPHRPGDVSRSFADISKAETLLGYAPIVSIRDGLKATCDWFLDSGR